MMQKQKLKILFLEDLPSDAGLVERELLRGAILFDLLVVDTRESYLNAVLEFSPDIILSDHSLPAFNSLQALKILKDNNLKIPFILVTSTISEEFAVEMMKLGAFDYILKDRLQRLPSAVINAIERQEFEYERQQFIDTIIANESYQKEAEKMAHFGSWQINLQTGTVKWSDETYRIFNYKPGEIIPSYDSFFKSIHKDDLPRVKEIVRKVNQQMQGMECDFRVVFNNGEIRYVHLEFAIQKDISGHPVFITGFNIDITQRKKSEKELRDSREKLRNLAIHLQKVREEERAEIAREIHDELGQGLTALKFGISWVKRHICEDKVVLEGKLDELLTDISETMISFRRIYSAIHPLMLEELGLLGAVQWLVNSFEKSVNIPIHFVSDFENLPLEINKSLALYRVVQESLTNISRYAKASKVNVSFYKIKEGMLCLKVEDNGIGFDQASVDTKLHHGILGMQERIHAIKGKMYLQSEPGKGTSVLVELPLV